MKTAAQQSWMSPSVLDPQTMSHSDRVVRDYLETKKRTMILVAVPDPELSLVSDIFQQTRFHEKIYTSFIESTFNFFLKINCLQTQPQLTKRPDRLA